MISLVELRPIHADNYRQCLGLTASVENENFVDPVAYSLAEAWVFYKDSMPFAIYDGEQMVGFVSMYIGEGNPQIINFLIDDAFRHKGLGTQAAKICIRYLQEEHRATRVSVPVFFQNLAARRFWEKIGFMASEHMEDGYVFMRLSL